MLVADLFTYCEEEEEEEGEGEKEEREENEEEKEERERRGEGGCCHCCDIFLFHCRFLKIHGFIGLVCGYLVAVKQAHPDSVAFPPPAPPTLRVKVRG